MNARQEQALQRFAIASEERRRALEQVRRAEQTMATEQTNAARYGTSVDLPVTAELLGGTLVTIDYSKNGEAFYSTTFTRRILEWAETPTGGDA